MLEISRCDAWMLVMLLRDFDEMFIADASDVIIATDNVATLLKDLLDTLMFEVTDASVVKLCNDKVATSITDLVAGLI
jgi:hypothetical protein